jgi:hypothetical protein
MTDDWSYPVFYGNGSATGVGPAQPREKRHLRACKSLSPAFIECAERGPVVEQEKHPIGFHLPREAE